MNYLKIHDKKYFTASLKAFNKKSQVTFDISPTIMKISSLDSPFIYLSFESDLFSADFESSFTIRIDELTKNLNLLDGSTLLLDRNFLIITEEACVDQRHPFFSYIKIPFINPIESFYLYTNVFHTKLLIQKESLKNFIQGKVHYSSDERAFDSSENILFIKNNTVDGCETLEINCEFLERGYLNFYCSNDWTEHVMGFYDLIHTVMLCFSDDLLCAKFILKEYSTAYLEIQVRSQV